MFSVRFLPDDRTYSAAEPCELMLAAAACDIWLEQPCGSKAICGKCRVRIKEGSPPVSLADQRLLTRDELHDGWRLACQLTISEPAVIEIPPVTRSAAAKPFGPADLFPAGFTPNVAKRYVEFTPPDEENQFAELDLLARSLGLPRIYANLEQLRAAPSILRDSLVGEPAAPHRVTATIADGELLALEPGDTSSRCFGVAVDLGSTTLAAALINLADGAVLASFSRLNPQVKYGGDIISRIHFAQEHPGDQLHRELISAVREMLNELAAQSQVRSDEIFSVAFAGNPTMIHSAVGADITSLGQAPYVGLWTRELTLSGRELDLPVHPRARLRFLPMIRSHVGADTVAGILASDLDSAGWSLLIDLGTNSEVVLACRDRLIATSTAAGPAFEGANIYHGMRAAPGAIDQVRISPDGRVVCKTVGNEPARGLCGSGLIDAAAELLRAGVIAPSGYMRKGDELAAVPEPLRRRCIILPDGQAAVRLDGEVVLTAQDVRQLQLIKGSIYAGVEILLREVGITIADLERVCIAGAFGNFLRKESAQAIGLVPDIDPETIHFIGNAAGIGARMVLVDQAARRRAIAIAERCAYVELAFHADYQDAFCNAMAFPAPV